MRQSRYDQDKLYEHSVQIIIESFTGIDQLAPGLFWPSRPKSEPAGALDGLAEAFVGPAAIDWYGLKPPIFHIPCG